MDAIMVSGMRVPSRWETALTVAVGALWCAAGVTMLDSVAATSVACAMGGGWVVAAFWRRREGLLQTEIELWHDMAAGYAEMCDRWGMLEDERGRAEKRARVFSERPQG